MNVLVIGSGGREHALAWKLGQSLGVQAVYAAPGNYATNLVGANLNIPVTDVEALASWAKENTIGLTVVGPETALAYGVVDTFRERGLRIVGPTQAAARLETSKLWAKQFMARHNIPTAAYREFSTSDEAERYLQSLGGDDFPLVVKADGLAGGKGVTVAADRASALRAVRDIAAAARRGPAQRVLVERFLTGYEVSFMAVADGVTALPLAPAHDYKRALDGDQGPMTGGMGAFSPAPGVDAALSSQIMDRIILPVVAGMAAEGMPYQGIIYAGLMLTADGPQVLEFNARFGDPEAQVVLPRLDDDLLLLLHAAAEGELAEQPPLRWSADATCGVVLASDGYPGEIETGYGILGLGEVGSSVLVFHNGTRNPYQRSPDLVTPAIERTKRGEMSSGMGVSGWFLPSRTRAKKLDRQVAHGMRDPYSQVVTAGGRVLTVVGRGRSLADARAAAYRGVEAISFTGGWCRGDIGDTP